MMTPPTNSDQMIATIEASTGVHMPEYMEPKMINGVSSEKIFLKQIFRKITALNGGSPTSMPTLSRLARDQAVSIKAKATIKPGIKPAVNNPVMDTLPMMP